MAELYVLTWFHREPRDREAYRTGWTKGLRAYLSEAEALDGLELVVERAKALAGEGETATDARDRDLGASSAEVMAYTLSGPPTLELLASVISSPPRGDPAQAWDPLGQPGARWWSSARMVRHWWGGLERVRADRPCQE